MKKKQIALIFILFLIGCAQVTSLNLTKHQFGIQPRKIIWVQIGGLSKEHIALLKYGFQSETKQTSFEKFLCYGSTWQYNLYDIRPDQKASFVSQLTGKANVKNECSDYDKKPIWSYLSDQGYKAGLFKTNTNDKKNNSCQYDESFYSGLTTWSMNKKVGDDVKYFHLEKEESYSKGTKYFDTSCLTGKCFNSASKNIVATFERFNKNSKRLLYVVQDTSYQEAILKQNFSKAKVILSELDLSIRYFQSYVAQNKDALLLITTAAPYNIDFPKQGTQWDEFIKNGKNIKIQKTELLSDVYAIGARSENFCGIYNQSDILTRIFSGAKQQGLKLEFINPFN